MGLTAFIAEYATRLIVATAYPGVFVLMVMESMVLPVPSEAVMPFAGFLVAEGKSTFAGVIAASTFGSIIGSLISYYIGLYGGKPIINKYGKYLLLNRADLEFTERFFSTYGEATIFICRFIPVVRHLISIPAGIGRMNVLKFSVLTILGAGTWNAILTVAGYYLKKNWTVIMKYSHIADIVVVAGLALLLGLFVWHHLKRK